MPAFAGTDSGNPEKIASVVQAATGEKKSDVAKLVAGSGEYTAATGNSLVTVGSASDSPVVIGLSDQGGLRLRMPSVGAQKSVQASDGTVVRPGTNASTSVQALTDGHVRALVTLQNESAPKSYDFGFDLPNGLKLQASKADAGLDIVSADGSIVAGRIEAPWAKDATGRSLHTWYEVHGSTVTQ
ncbi:hypothetical protein ACQKF3_12720, partial [Staphylococcus capitis]